MVAQLILTSPRSGRQRVEPTQLVAGLHAVARYAGLSAIGTVGTQGCAELALGYMLSPAVRAGAAARRLSEIMLAEP